MNTSTTDITSLLLREVPQYTDDDNHIPGTLGAWVRYNDILAALSRYLDPAFVEKATLTVLRLRSGLDNADRGADGKRELGGVVLTMNDAADLINALLTQNAALRAERDDALTFLDNAISKAPEPLKALGKYLAGKLDEDEWPTAEQYLNAAAKACADRAEAAEAQIAALRAEARKSAMDAVSAGCQAQEAWEAQKAAPPCPPPRRNANDPS
jgi:hypothetical protein